MKIDVEGMEIMVMKGSNRILSNQRPVVMAESNYIRDSWPVVDYLMSLGYKTWLHYAPAYRKENLRGEQQNIYGNCGEANLLAIPHEHLDRFTIPSNILLTLRPITDLDALAAAMLQKPQYCEYLTSAYQCERTGEHPTTIAALRKEINDLRDSTSMRVTRPARFLARSIRRLARRL